MNAKTLLTAAALFTVSGFLGSTAEEEVAGLPAISAEERLIALEDLDGKKLTPLSCDDGIKASVVIFITIDCPIANAYQPAIRRIGERFSDQALSLTLVQVDPDVSKDDARKHASEYGIDLPVVRDPDHALVRATGATITPEAVVLKPDGEIVYRGRINDWYSDLGVRRRAPRTNELTEAIDAVLAGKTPEVKVAPAIGCFIADFRRDAAGE